MAPTKEVFEVAKGDAQDLVDFLNASWTAFHAVEECKMRLLAAGYTQLRESEEWKIEAGGNYFFTRNLSTIAAFSVGNSFAAGDPFWVVAAHTDSPCLKLKPNSKVNKPSFQCVGVQPYGGGLWHTWFDRDLGLAGKVVIKREGEGEEGRAVLEQRLLKIDRPILRIPNLAIHLDREVNSTGFKPNTQTHVLPLLATAVVAELNSKAAGNGEREASSKEEKGGSGEAGACGPQHHSLLLQLLSSSLSLPPSSLLDFDLQLCDVQPSTIGGAADEFIFSGRLDNLASSFTALKALLNVTSATPVSSASASASQPRDNGRQGEIKHEHERACERGVRMVLLFDHEECGSGSAQGASSPLLLHTMARLTAAAAATAAAEGGRGIGGSSEGLLDRALRKSFIVSADMAHALHPNYPEKHEDSHQPRLHAGLVIKHNANQRYATNAVTAAMFREVAVRRGIPTQEFVVRNDTGCGSTIGPILSIRAGVRTVDVGQPQLSMHSCREMAGTVDVMYAIQHYTAFFEDFPAIDASFVSGE